jgi:hypothetical protein
MSSPAPAACADAESFAPELPLDALRIVLARHAGDVAQLCAAACVSRAWRAAAAERQLWKALHNFLHLKHTTRAPRLLELTEARLAELATRAGSGVDGEPHLAHLSFAQDKLTSITARGVAAALAHAGLEGKLDSLYVAGVLSSEGDDDVIPLLESFVTDYRYAVMMIDVDQHLLCDTPQEDGGGEPPTCSRLCEDRLCVWCDINRCCWCFPRPYGIDFRGTPVCQHMCAHCGTVHPEDGLWQCSSCSDRRDDDDEDDDVNLCEDCVCFCSECGEARCYRCCFDDMHGCTHCELNYCERCDRGVEWAWCALCKDNYCTGHNDCAAGLLKTAAEWVAELQEREDGVDAAVIERLAASLRLWRKTTTRRRSRYAKTASISS